MKKITSISALASFLMVATAMPVFAQTTNTTGTTIGTTAGTNTINIPCIQVAVGKRDDAIGAAVGTLATTLQQALSARKTALQAAWAMTDRKARRDALKAAWATYKTAARQARKTLTSADKAAWDQFRNDRKACGVNGTNANDEDNVASHE